MEIMPCAPVGDLIGRFHLGLVNKQPCHLAWTAPLRRWEKIGWQAEAPAPRACKSFASKVGQTLSSASPAIRPIFSQLLTVAARNRGRSRDRQGAVGTVIS